MRLRPLRLALAVAAALATLTPAARALAPDWRASQYMGRHFAAAEGLPHGLANAVAQTSDGYLWVGTEQGLARFDGRSFRTFDRRSGMPTNIVSALAVDRAGALWGGTRDRGLGTLAGGVFTPVAADAIGAQVRALAVDGAGDLWVGTHGRGVARLRDRQVIATLRLAEGLPSEDVRAVLAAHDGSIWLGTFAGAVHVVDGRPAGPGALAELAGVPVHALAEDRRGDLWLGTERGLARLRAGTLSFVDTGPLHAREILRLLFDRDGNLWIGTPDGLARRSEDGRVEQRPLPDARVLALFEDRDGTVWEGTERGLERLSAPDFRPLGEPEGLTDASAFGVLEDSSGATWVTTAAGAFRIPPGGGPAANVAPDRGTVYAIHEDARGDVWIGARDGSVGRHRAGRFAWLGRRPWEKVRAITEIAGVLWLGTDHGLFRLEGARLEDAVAVVPDVIVSAIAPDAGGALWLGTEGRGLLRLEGAALVPAPPGGPSPSSSVATIARDADGTLWFGTEGDGLWRLRDGRWASFSTKDGLFDDVVWRILDDGHGALWLSSNLGIARVAREELEARARGGAAPIAAFAYGEDDGMRDRECNGAVAPAGWRARDGRLWFPTGRGVAIVDPARVAPPSTPTALIDGVRVDGKEVPLGSAIVAAPGTSRFELRYLVPELRTPERVRFRYRLEGFDPGWNMPGGERLAQYTNLGPGTYAFVVQAAAGGAWGQEARLEVTLLPHVYQTAWFHAAVAAVALLAILAIPLLRVRQLRAREAELARRVQEALGEVKVLSGMLPICAWCKKIRDDQGYWNKIEAYLHERTNARFSHGMCPDCFAKAEADAADADEGGSPPLV